MVSDDDDIGGFHASGPYVTICISFSTDAYDLFCIATVTKVPKPGGLPLNVNAAVNGVALCGTLAGQLVFGWLGDKMGRKRVYGMTLLLMIIC